MTPTQKKFLSVRFALKFGRLCHWYDNRTYSQAAYAYRVAILNCQTSIFIFIVQGYLKRYPVISPREQSTEQMYRLKDIYTNGPNTST
jgi:hypothetical protein